MRKFIPVFLIFSLSLSGCVTNSPDTLLSVGDGPVGTAQKDGNYPKINQVPTGQTKHFTKNEKTKLKTDIKTSVQKAEAQAAQDSQAAYLKEVKAMQKLAAEKQKKRLADIESRKF